MKLGVYQARIGVDPQPLIVVAEESQPLPDEKSRELITRSAG